MILRVCEACEKPAPPGPARSDDTQSGLASGANLSPILPAGWIHVAFVIGDDGAMAKSPSPADVCSPRCLRVWAEAVASGLERERVAKAGTAGAAAARYADVVTYQHAPDSEPARVHSARIYAVQRLARDHRESSPHPHYAECPVCLAPATVDCRQ